MIQHIISYRFKQNDIKKKSFITEKVCVKKRFFEIIEFKRQISTSNL